MDKYTDIFIHNTHNIIKPNINKINGSIKELVDVQLTQSQLIRLGLCLEKSIVDILKTIHSVEVMNVKKLDNIQLDLLFKYNGIIYYFEIKSNINLDSEKCDKVRNKISRVKQLLFEKYRCRIISGVLCLRFHNFNHISRKKFIKPMLRDVVIGYETFFNIFDIKMSQERWNRIFKHISTTLTQHKSHLK